MKQAVLWTCALACATSTVHAQSIDSLWNNNCVNCHGERGEGGGAGTRSLLTDDRLAQSLDREFFDIIKSGKPEGGMEGFGAAMSDPQIWGLVVHIRELQEQAHRKRVGDPKAKDGVYAASQPYTIETVIDDGLDVPWSVDWLPDGTMLVTNRSGELNTWDGKKLSKPIGGTPAVRNRGQGGLMDVAVHPDYAKNSWIYLAFSDRNDQGGRNSGMTKIVRGKLVNNEWTQQQTIFEAKAEHYVPTDQHFGCRIVFDTPTKDGKRALFFGIGERGMAPHAQDLKRPNGKIHRVWDDGTIPQDNPFVATDGAYQSIWSYGHRNPQGLAFGQAGTLWDTEHGPRGGDEVNKIEKGRNYGWPIVSFGMNYNGTALRTPFPDTAPAEDKATEKNIAMPVMRWLPSIGACGLDVIKGEAAKAFSSWSNDLVAGGLSGENVDRIRIKDGAFVEREELVHGMGRVRDVVCGPDGAIYVVLNGPDKVIRLVAQKPKS